MEIFKDLFPLEDRWGKDGVFTPTNIVKDMIDLLPDSIWNPESTFIDISCKTGAFLAEIYTRLDTELSKLDEYKDPVKRRSHILNNQLFGLALRNDESLFFSRRNVFGDPFSDNIDVINAGNSSYLDLVKQKQYSIIETQLKGKFGRMKFDVVVGNPPYNNDIYLKFVAFGHRLSTQYTLMITPAKWQAKTDGKPAGSSTVDKNVEFRTKIVPFMSKIVYYPCADDIFDIVEADGIQYYILSKENSTYKDIQIKCKRQPALECTWYKSNVAILVNELTLQIIRKAFIVGGGSLSQRIEFEKYNYVKDKLYIEVYNESEIEVWGGTSGMKFGMLGMIDSNNLKTLNGISKYKVFVNKLIGDATAIRADGKRIGMIKPRILGPNQVYTSNFGMLGVFDSKTEALSMLSYFDTKFVRFLMSVVVSGAGLTKQYFRWVPDPGKFDHIFTDEELYNKYGLTDDEIKVIESVIKERKQ